MWVFFVCALDGSRVLIVALPLTCRTSGLCLEGFCPAHISGWIAGGLGELK